MANVPRQHHFVPVFHLAGFTDDGSADGALYVFDRSRRQVRRSRPAKVARRRDWNRHDGATLKGSTAVLDPFHLERELAARLEGPCRHLFGELTRSLQVPGPGPDLNLLINYIAQLMVRTPEARQRLEEIIDVRMREEFADHIRTDAGWAASADACREIGIELSEADRDDWIQGLEAGDWKLSLDQTTVVCMTQQFVEMCLPLLAARSWGLGVVADGVAGLVCSDSPIGLRPIPGAQPEVYMGLFSASGEISIPITSTVVLLSRGASLPRVSTLQEADVAAVNRATAMFANDVYCAERAFLWRDGAGRICRVDERLATRS